jgi:hypothetical protein
MTQDFNHHEMEQKLKHAQKFTLTREAKARIQEKLRLEAEKIEKKKERTIFFRKTSIWISSIAAIIVFTFFTISNLQNGISYDNSEDKQIAIEAPKDLDKNQAEDSVTQDSIIDEDQHKMENADRDKSNAAQKKDEERKTQISQEFIIARLNLGMSKEEVASIFGNQYTVVWGKDTTEIWRFDLGKAPDYTPLTEKHGNVLLDNIDEEGIKNGNIHIQLFVNWKNDIVSSYSFYYLDETKQKVMEYHHYEDNTIEETIS